MKELKRLAVLVPALALLGLLVVLYASRGTMEQLAFLRRGGGEAGLVDQRPYQTAQTLSVLAVSAEEQRFAQEAERLADHEVDQSFAMALRLASMQQRSLSGSAQAMAAKVEGLKQILKDDKAKVDQLDAAAKASGVAASEGDDLDVAKAQAGLDADELADATDDLARETGDDRVRIQTELAAYQASTKRGEGQKETAVVAARRYGSLWGRVSAWLDQRSRVTLLAQAETKAEEDAKSFARQHDALEGKNDAAAKSTSGKAGSARVKALETMAGQRVVMSILDDRGQTDQQLGAVYGRWQQQVWMQHRIVRYLILESLAWIAFVLLGAALTIVLGRATVRRVVKEARKAGTLETILTLGVEGLALVGVLLVLLGVPQQMPTILGLAGAGLTVVFQDFILAFFGWFVLMGKNGMRVCDWVEINGVGGEVSEIGLFRTTLLETGNWTSRGHPTGRKITFINSFAIRGTFFNFSTHGQWMWDELKLSVAGGAVAYESLQKLQAAVEEESAKDKDEAEEEWRRAAGSVALGQFGAAPTVDLRPAGSGIDVVVRYMTRATERFDRRNRLYETLLGILRETDGAAVEATSAQSDE